MTEIEMLKAENKRLKGELSYLRSRCVQGAEKYFDSQKGLLKIVTVRDDATPKEKAELLNIRKRVEAQRIEIKCLNEQLERNKEYSKRLENLIENILQSHEYYKSEYQNIIHTE